LIYNQIIIKIQRIKRCPNQACADDSFCPILQDENPANKICDQALPLPTCLLPMAYRLLLLPMAFCLPISLFFVHPED
jgi:hypothetical protein